MDAIILKDVITSIINDNLWKFIGIVVSAGIMWWFVNMGRNIFAGCAIRNSELYKSKLIKGMFSYGSLKCRIDYCGFLRTKVIDIDSKTVCWFNNSRFYQIEKWEWINGDGSKIV